MISREVCVVQQNKNYDSFGCYKFIVKNRQNIQEKNYCKFHINKLFTSNEWKMIQVTIECI